MLANSGNLWERRIAIVASRAFIEKGDLNDTFAISALLLDDKHDLIHKSMGWMLREAGKRSAPALLDFLRQNYSSISRTALRYAIERFPEPGANVFSQAFLVRLLAPIRNPFSGK
jgi:3-methyladenine DNA glycosylase AlkD